jgi:hypothetical protein
MTVTFNPIHYKDTTRDQWDDAASAWHGTGNCIKAKGVLTSHQSGEAGPSSAVENRNNQAFNACCVASGRASGPGWVGRSLNARRTAPRSHSGTSRPPYPIPTPQPNSCATQWRSSSQA